MSYKNMLIVGMALIGALALLTGTFVTIPTVLAYIDPNLKSYTDPNERYYGDPNERYIGDPNERVFVR